MEILDFLFRGDFLLRGDFLRGPADRGGGFSEKLQTLPPLVHDARRLRYPPSDSMHKNANRFLCNLYKNEKNRKIAKKALDKRFLML